MWKKEFLIEKSIYNFFKIIYKYKLNSKKQKYIFKIDKLNNLKHK